MKSEKLTVGVYADTTVTADSVAYDYFAADPVDLDGDFAAEAADASVTTCADDLTDVSYACGDDLACEIRRTIAELFMLLILSLWLNE